MSSKQTLKDFESVNIDPSGRFKYVLIRLKQGNDERYIVRGFEWAEYHADIVDDFEKSITNKDIKTVCVGGGRILHESNKILVYGYSQGFGRPDHSISVGLIKEKYPNYESITFSNEGY